MLDFARQVYNRAKQKVETLSNTEYLLLAILAVLLHQYENKSSNGSNNYDGPYGYGNQDR